jgi:hypothetical protein
MTNIAYRTSLTVKASRGVILIAKNEIRGIMKLVTKATTQ